jgi:hypothetical protein
MIGSGNASPKLYLEKRTYLVGWPPSEQPPVLCVTNNPWWVGAEHISISRDQLLGFISVYVRLYQVPAVNTEHLRRWYDINKDLVKTWDCGGFWNTQLEDSQRNLNPRTPGIPSEARPHPYVDDVMEPLLAGGHSAKEDKEVWAPWEAQCQAVKAAGLLLL